MRNLEINKENNYIRNSIKIIKHLGVNLKEELKTSTLKTIKHF